MLTDRCHRFCPECHQKNRQTMARERCDMPVVGLAEDARSQANQGRPGGD